MKKIMKKIIPFILAMFVAITALPANAFAAAGCYHEPTDERRVEQVGSEVTDVDTYAKCSKCGDWYLFCTNNPDSLSQATKHNWVQADVGNPDCTHDGFVNIRCTVCNTVVTQITQPAEGHAWSDWTVSIKADCEHPGEEARICGTCHATETRTVPATGHNWTEWKEDTSVPETDGMKTYTRQCLTCQKKESQVTYPDGTVVIGSQGLKVKVLQWLLSNCDQVYTGPIDGVYGDELANAVKKAQEIHGFSATGNATPSFFNFYTSAYLISWFTGVGDEYEYILDGTDISAQPTWKRSNCKSNGDKTHTCTVTFDGVLFAEGNESFKTDALVPWDETKDGKKPKEGEADSWKAADYPDYQAERTEACSLLNKHLLCPYCGYRLEMSSDKIGYPFNLKEGETAEIPEGLAFVFDQAEDYLERNQRDGWVYMEVRGDENLPIIYAKMYGDTMVWDPIEGAASYKMNVYKRQGYNVTSVIDPQIIDKDITIYDFDGLLEKNTCYEISLVAQNEEKHAISQTSRIYYLVTTRTPDIFDVELVDENVEWSPEYELDDKNSKYVLNYEFSNGGSGLLAEVYDRQYAVGKYPLTNDQKEMLKNKVFRISVTAYDSLGQGNTAFSEWTTINTGDCCKVLVTANLRSGPGKDYERVGGVKAGTFVTPVREEGEYTEILYGGELSWILTKYLAYCETKVTIITLNIDTLNGTIITEQPTELDGTLKVRIDPSWDLGDYEIVAWSDRRTGLVDLKTKIFDHPMDLYAILEPKTNIIRFIDYNGKERPELQMEAKSHEPVIGLPKEIDGVSVEWRLIDSDTKVYEGDKLKYRPNGVTLVADRAMDNWVKISVQCYLYEYKNALADVIDFLPSGTEVCILSRPEYLSYVMNPENAFDQRQRFYTYVKTREGDEGYIFTYTLLENVTPTVYFDAREGFCAIGSLQTHAMLYDNYNGTEPLDKYGPEGVFDPGELPVAVRDGYEFIGWYYDDGTIYRSLDTFWKNTVLHARYVKQTEKMRDILGLGKVYNVELIGDYDYLKFQLGDSHLFSSPIIKAYKDYGDYYAVYSEVGKGYISKDDVFENYCFCRLNSIDGLEIEEYGKRSHVTTFDKNGVDMLNHYGVYSVGTKKGYTEIIYFYNGEWRHGWVDTDDQARAPQVRFEPCGGVITKEGSSSRPKTGVLMYLPLPKAKKENSKFLGWYTDPYLGDKVSDGEYITETLTLYAHYSGDHPYFVVKKDKTKIHVGANTLSRYNYLDAGTVVVCLGSKDGLIHVEVDGKEGWILEEDLKEGEIGVIEGINSSADKEVRKSASKNSKDVGNISIGETLLVVGKENGYYKVAGGAWGYDYVYISTKHRWSGSGDSLIGY